MAEIDKGLPSNTRTEVNITSEDELQVDVKEDDVEKGPMSQGLPGLLKRVRNL